MQRLALIERDALIALDVTKTLESAGYGPVGVFPDCRALAESGPRNFELVIFDLGARGEGCGDLLASLAAKGPRILLVAALEDEAVMAEARRAEAVGILHKPFSRRELLEALEIGLYRARMEERLSRSVRRYRSLFDASLSPRCISSFPAEGGLILERNAAFAALFPKADSLAQIFAAPEEWLEIGGRIAAGEVLSGMELRMLGAEGAQLQIIGSFSAVADEGGDRRLVSAELFDVTESRLLRDELVQAQKMESLGRLSGGIAHDFNNILTAIKGHAELLAMETDRDSEAFQDLEGIRKASAKASALTRQLLGFSRKQPYAPRRLDLAELLRGATSLLRKLAGDGVAFAAAIPEGVFPVVADPVRLEQVLVNLVVNARDALEGRPDPFLRLGLEPANLRTASVVGDRSLPAGAYCRVEVADNGSGMSPAVAAKLFTPFFTTKAPDKGTGLGLSTVADIVLGMGGAIEVSSTPGTGSSFAFWLPAAPGGGGESPSEPGAGEAEVPRNEAFWLEGRPELLVADADESVLAFACHALERAGARVVPAANAGEALIFAERRRFDCLVLDIPLPGIDGLELYARLREGGRGGWPCVFTSGKGWPEARGLPEGCLFLEKPYSPADLVAALGSVLPSVPKTAS